MKRHLSRHPWLLAGFLLAFVLTGFFAIRLIASTIYWSENRDRPIEGWMPIGYIAQSWDVPRDRLARAIELEPGAFQRKSLAHIAEERGEPVEVLIARIETAIADARNRAVVGDD